MPNQAFHKLLSRISLHIEHGELLRFSTLALKDFKIECHPTLNLYQKETFLSRLMDTLDNGTERLTWFEPGIALHQIRQHAEAAKRDIRIATGYFTIRGWDKIRQSLRNKQVYLLVGIDEPGEERAYQFVVRELMRDLQTGLHRERRQAVVDLVERIQSEQLQIVDARARDHHSKNYLFDRKVAIITSANLTGRGLAERIESGGIHTDLKEVNYLVNQFDRYFAEARNITQELLEVLLRWLDFVSPWDIYLKTMLSLEQLPTVETKYSKHPSAYQVDMIARTLSQLRVHNGSMLVASTGLGKTVVAIHVALRLKQAGEIDNIMVVGLAGNVQTNWRKHFQDAGLPLVYISMKPLDQGKDSKAEPVTWFEEVAEQIGKSDHRWLVIIDESHELRNRFRKNALWEKKRTERQAFKRLRQVCHSSHAKVLLLTGSPYAKDEENLNNQLYLLPHTAPQRTLIEMYMEDEATSWRIETVDEFADLPVVSQLTTPHVARFYGHTEGNEIYIKRGEEKFYIPHLILRSASFRLPLQSEIISILERRYLKLDIRNRIWADNIERQTKVSWASSPWALLSVFEQVCDTPGGKNAYPNAKFIVEQSERQQVLQPIVQHLKRYTRSRFACQNDEKFQALLELVRNFRKQNHKIVIFCERHATVAYLAKLLGELMPQMRVAATISQTEAKYDMKDSKEIEAYIKQFAPQANDYKCPDSEQYDVFICTDAQGVGINMQDASVVINYDIAWTPIDPIQRAGRILRFCPTPRTVEVITFVPSLNEQTPLRFELGQITYRWERLMERHGESRKLIQMPVLTGNPTQEVNMLDVPGVTIRSAELDLLEELARADASPFYQHTANLQNHRDYALALKSDLVSALTTNQVRSPHLYILLNYRGEFYPLLYNPQTLRVTKPDPIEILNLIACPQATGAAIVRRELVEEMSDACIQVWVRQNQVDPNEVLRECTLYLKPESEGDTADNWFEA